MPKKARPVKNVKRITHVLPSAMIIPNIELSNELSNELTELAATAEQRLKKQKTNGELELVAVIMAPTRVTTAIAWFVSAKHHHVSLPDFRDEIDSKNKASLAAAVDILLDRLPGDAKPPLAQMRSLYCYGDAESNGINSRDTAEELTAKNLREDRWAAQHSARAVRSALEQWKTLFLELKDLAGNSKPPITAEKSFVKALASYWKDELGARLGSSRHDNGGQNGQQGLFAKFVRKAAEGIPKEFGIPSWDHAIREISEDKS
jgi:hypothetical protein